jgi:hypothetical protein
MNEERMQILNMLAEGKITPQEAEQLLGALDNTVEEKNAPVFSMEKGAGEIKYLFVKVEPKPGSTSGEMVNIRVPLALVKAGMDFVKLIPMEARGSVNEAMEKSGVSWDPQLLKSLDYENLVQVLSELNVDIETNDQTVKVYVG